MGSRLQLDPMTKTSAPSTDALANSRLIQADEGSVLARPIADSQRVVESSGNSPR
jgi:hypothetical protein